MTHQNAQDLIGALEGLINARIRCMAPQADIADAVAEIEARQVAVEAVKELVATERT